MKEIPLTRGMVAIVDDDVYEWASKLNWYAHNTRNHFYAARRSSRDPVNGKSKMIYLHREIMNPGPGEEVDHKFGNTLDNRRSEMRNATRAQNMRAFRKLKENKSSKFRGVCWNKRALKWLAHIEKNGQRPHLGYFSSEEDAARAYDKAARELFGGFARPNFPA